MSSPVDETVRVMKKIYDNSFCGKMVDVCDIYRFYDSKLAEEITKTANEMMEEINMYFIREK